MSEASAKSCSCVGCEVAPDESLDSGHCGQECKFGLCSHSNPNATLVKLNQMKACPSGSSQTVLLVRHGKSIANEYKFKHGHDAVESLNAAENNFFNSGLSLMGYKSVLKHGLNLWNKVETLEPQETLIVCSPIKRALQTCLLSLLSYASSASLFSTPPRIYVMPMVMEAGDTAENNGICIDALKTDPDIILMIEDIYSKMGWDETDEQNLLDYSYFYSGNTPKLPNHRWWDMSYRDNNAFRRAHEFESFLERRREDRGEGKGKQIIIVFTHWGFCHGLTRETDTKNFGIESEEDKSSLHERTLLIRHNYGMEWEWFLKKH